MSDVNHAESRPLASPLYLRDEELKQGADLLCAAYSQLFTGEEGVLAVAGLGRAHRRALLVIARNPGITISGLLRHLRVTKQSANRVLNDLFAAELVERRPATQDRRMRQLHATAKGCALEAVLWETQRPRLVRAFREAGPEAVLGFQRVLNALVGSEPKSRKEAERQ
jgi:DNA-binding MarR family transcriptional regulator